MTELDFYKFITDNNVEYRYEKNNNRQDVIIWVCFWLIGDFVKLCNSPSLWDEGGIEVRLQDHQIAIWVGEICDHFGLDLEKIFQKL